MIIGAHSILYSTDGDADREFLRSVLRLPSVDVGRGWLIFGLPPAEVAVHPGPRNDVHELYLMCDDVAGFVADMAESGVPCSPPKDQGWGVLTQVTLPGGGKLGVYEPRHARPRAAKPRSARSRTTRPKAASRKPTAPRKKKVAAKKVAAKKRPRR